MYFHYEQTGVLQRRIQVSFSVEEIDAALTVEKNKKNTVPAHDAASLNQSVSAALANTAVTVACARFSLLPVGRVRAACSGPATEGQPLSCTLALETLPEVPLPQQCEAVTVHVEEPIVQPGELRNSLHRLAHARGIVKSVSEPRLPQDGDILELDINGSYEGRHLPSFSASGFLLQLHPGQEDMKIVELARALRVGEEKTAQMRCPDDYPEIPLRGKEITLRVRLNALREKKPSALDDNLAVSLGKKNFQELYGAVHNASLKSKLDASRHAAEEELLASLADSAEFPVPECLIALHLKTLLLEARRRLLRQGCDQATLQRELDAINGGKREEARRMAKRQTWLMALGYREHICVSDEDVNRELKELGAACGQDSEILRQNIEQAGAMPELQDRLIAEKALAYLYKKANKIIVDVHGNTVSRPQMMQA